jgi:hypothetical protein
MEFFDGCFNDLMERPTPPFHIFKIDRFEEEKVEIAVLF